MIIRYDLNTNELSDYPQLIYFIKDTCLYAYEPEKFFTHSHAEICYIISGRGNLKINNTVYELHEGDIYVLNPYVQHCEFLNRDKKEGFTYYILGINHFKLQSKDEQEVYVPRHLPLHSNILYLLNKIFDELNGKLQDHSIAVEKYFQLLLIETNRLYCGKIEKPFYANSDLSAQIRNYIDVNYAGEISAKSIADYFDKKLNTIEIKFKKSFGMSMQSYILMKRIEGAKRILESNHNISITNCAILMGFYNPTYFSRYFKKITGISPREYSRLQRQNIPK